MLPENLPTQDKLIAAATTLFAEKGYAATTVKDVADAAGVNISLVSYHFQGKENLYKACIGKVGLANYEMTKQLLQPAETAEEFKVRLQLFIENLLLSYAENPSVNCIIHRECDTPSPFFDDLFQSIFLKNYEVIVSYIAHAQNIKIVRSDLSADGIASLIVGSILHHGRSATLVERFFGKSLSDPLYRKEITTVLIGIMTKGIFV